MKNGDPFGLEDLALETGSTLEFPNGRKFNSAGMRTTRRVSEPAAVAAPPPAPPPAPAAPDLTPLLQQLIAAVNRPVEVTIPPMPAPQVTVTAPAQKLAAAPTSWTFDFERNSNGTIKRIKATATGD